MSSGIVSLVDEVESNPVNIEMLPTKLAIGKDEDGIYIRPISLLDKVYAMKMSIEENTMTVKDMSKVKFELVKKLARSMKKSAC